MKTFLETLDRPLFTIAPVSHLRHSACSAGTIEDRVTALEQRQAAIDQALDRVHQSKGPFRDEDLANAAVLTQIRRFVEARFNLTLAQLEAKGKHAWHITFARWIGILLTSRYTTLNKSQIGAAWNRSCWNVQCSLQGIEDYVQTNCANAREVADLDAQFLASLAPKALRSEI